MIAAKEVATDQMFDETAAFFNRPKYKYFVQALSRDRRFLLAVRILFSSLMRFRLARYAAMSILILFKRDFQIPCGGDFLFWGASVNNRKVLEPLHNDIQDLGHYELNWGGRNASFGQRLAVLSNIGSLWKLSGEMRAYRDVHAFAALQLLTLGAAKVFFDQILKAELTPRVIVMANDHSPICVALRAAAKEKGIMTVYRQHAPVTPAFPPLKFDLSILFDAISDSYYPKEGRGGPVLIQSPFDSDHTTINTTDPLRKVGLCLSVVWKEAAVKQVIAELLARSNISRILLRPHPADTRDPSKLLLDSRVVLQPAGQSVKDFCNLTDLIVVPNTGFPIEAMHLGTPCIYRHGMDELNYDFYGFVSEGVLPDYTATDLTGDIPLDNFFDADWYLSFARFDSTIGEPLQVARARVVEALVTLHASAP